MAKISTYPIISIPTLNDLLIGTDVENLNETKNFSLGDISGLIGQGFVPYVGATENVNLGLFSIEASSFIVDGGLASEFVKADGSLDSTVYVPETRTLTINGETYNLSADRSWDINSIDSLTTIGTSGAATYIGKVLNIPVYQPQGNYITQLSGEATGSGPGNASVTLDNTAVISKVLTGLNVTGGTVVDTDTILQAFGKVQNQINGLAGGVEYQGVWNAATNTPFLQSSVGVQGYYYVVNVAGNTNLNGITDWQVGDWAIFNGSTWDKVDNTDAVISVNGYVGAVVLTASDVGAVPTTRTLTINGVGYDLSLDRAWTVGDVRTDQSYINPSWIVSLDWGKITSTPTTLAGYGITDGALNTTTLTINGTTYDLTENRTWSVGTVTSIATTGPITGGTITGSGTIGITQAGASSDGYLSSTDWNAFNNKQEVISVTAPLTFAAGVVGITQSGAATDGYLSSTDWNTFNSKVGGSGTANTLPMWGSSSSLVNSPLSYAADTFNFQYNSATGGAVVFTNSNGAAYAYTIQMNNFGSPRSTVHGYTDGLVIQSIGGTQVSRMFANGNMILGTGTVETGHKLTISGDLFVNTIINAITDTDRFIVSDGGIIKYRTGAEVLADIGAQGSLTLTTTGTSGASTLIGNTLNIPQYTDQFVGTVTSVGLSMPSAFSVSNSPITSSGTIAVTGAGTASQYVRGDGTLADFPSGGGGGGSSVSYYLNGSISQGTIGGVAYRELSKVPILGTGTDISINADGYIASFITDAGDPNLLEIPAGSWNFETYFSASSGGGSPTFYVELYKYDGTTFTLIASNSATPELIAFGTNIQPYFSSLAVPQTTLLATDRLAVRYYVVHSGRTITLHTENGNLCQIITTFTTGLTALNGLTAQVQYFQVGTSGTDFNIASATATHTFNLPTASAVNRGALSSADWAIFNGKQNAITLTTTGTSGVSTLVGSTLNIPNYSTDLSGYVTLDTTQTITGFKTILRGGDVLNFKIGTDTLYGLKVAYNQNELVPSGEATWSFVNTFNNGSGTGLETTPISFFRGVLVTGERLLSASVNTNLLDYYSNNPSGRYPIYAYNTGVQQFASSIIVGETTGVVDAITGAIADLPAGVVANFKGRVIGSNAVNNNEFVTLGQVTSTSRAAISLTTTGTSGPATYSSVTGVLNIPEYQGGVTSFNTRTGAVTLTSLDVTTALGFNPVTDLRTLTINGETYDLTANRSWTVGVNPSAREIETFIATAGQTTFTVTGGYTVGLVDVFINGVRLTSSDYTATNGTTVVLTVGTMVGNIVDIIKYTSGLVNSISGTGTTNYLPKFTGSTTIGNSLVYDNGSTVLIGTTSTPTPVVGVSFPLSITSAQATRIRIDSSRGAPNYANAGVGLYASDVQKWSFAHYSTDSGANYDFTIYNDALTSSAILIKGSNSNVLIGSTTDNGARLQVSGEVRISGVAEYLRSVQNSTLSQAQTWYAADGITRRAVFGFRSGGSDNFTLLNERNGSMFIGTNDATNLTITSSGNVLIGTGTAPSAIGVNDLLVIGKSGSASNAINFSNGSTTNWGYLLAESGKIVLGSGTSSNITFETNAGSERMRITSTGNVGIGTASPDVFGRFYTQTLGLSSSGSTAIQINGGSGGYGQIDFGAAGVRTAGISASANETQWGSVTGIPAIIYTNGATRLTINGTTGAATFSSTLQSTHIGINNTPTLARLFANQTTDGEWIATFKNYGGSSSYGVSIDMSGSTSNQSALQVYTRSGNGLKLVNTGNLLVGTFSDNGARLQVSGDSTFSGKGTFNDLVTTTSVYRIVQASVARGGLYTYNQVTGSGTDYGIGLLSEAEAFIATGGTITKRLTIASTGEATFSSSVTATQFYWGGTVNNNLSAGSISIVDSGTGTKYLQLSVSNTVANIATNYTNSNIPLTLNSYGNTNQLYLSTSGNVLIGTTTDNGNKLQINGRIYGNGFRSSSQIFGFFPNSTGSFEWEIGSDSFVGTGMYMYNSSNAYVFRLTAAGVLTTSGGGTSDIRTKEDISPINESVLPFINELNPVSFKFINDVNKKTRRGFIAQEVLETSIPSLVLGDGEKEGGIYGLDYDGILALAIKAIQELKAELDELKSNN
jgi:hypothetical protein